MFRFFPLVCLLTLPAVAQVVPFFSPTLLRSGVSNASQTRLADVNGDGLPDLIFFRQFQSSTNNIEYQLNLGDDFFGPGQIIGSGFHAGTAIELADLNGDGRPDLGASGRDGSGIRIYHHNGDGFTEVQRFDGFNSSSMLFADINGDGRPDLVYQHSNSGHTQHSILWRPNDGAGQFGEARNISSAAALHLMAADIDRDGDPDIVALQPDSNSIVWHRNNGGTFAAAAGIVTGVSGLIAMDVADFNGDGYPDLAAASGSTMRLVRNNAGNNFTQSGSFTVSGFLEMVKFVRADDDAFPDLVYEGNNALLYRRNLGTGNFGAQQTFPQATSSYHEMLAADYDGDGRDDLILTASGGGNAWLYRNGTGSPPNVVSFAPANNTVAAHAPATLNWNVEHAASIRIDGVPVSGSSLAVTAGGESRTYTLTATNAFGSTTARTTVFVPKRLFADPEVIATGSNGNWSDFEIGDIDGDGIPDLVYFSLNLRMIGWRAGEPRRGEVGPHTPIATGLNSLNAFVLHDLDKDGDLDIVAAYNYQVFLLRNDGTGNFSPPQAISGQSAGGIVVADLDGDGWDDLIYTNIGLDGVHIALNDGSGNFAAPSLVSGSGPAEALIAADVDGDGVMDLIISSNNPTRLMRGTGPATFGPAEDIPTRARAPLLFYDIDGDGLGDFIFRGGYITSTYNIGILRGRGLGYFHSPLKSLDIANLGSYAAGDFDGDGDLDFGFVMSGSGVLRPGWLEGDGLGNFSSPFTTAAQPADSFRVKARDLDGDGDLDLVASTGWEIFWMRNVAEPSSPPVIDRFESVHPVLHRGESVDLVWDVTGDSTVTISPGIGEVSGGRVTVRPAETTTYILTATNAAGTVTKEITVTVVDRPVIHAFAADADDVHRTTPITLSWTVVGADSLSLSPGIGAISGNSVTVPVYGTTVFTLTATNAEGSDTATVEVAVKPDLFRYVGGIPGTSINDINTQAVADLDLDGFPDLIAAGYYTNQNGSIYWIRSRGNGTFEAPRIIQANSSYGANDITVADFDGDGRPDLAAASGSIGGDTPDSRLQWFRNRPGNQWIAQSIETGGETITHLHAVDWDLDGRPDLVGASGREGELVWFRNLGSGRFARRASPLEVSLGEVTRISSTDIDGDHDPDLIISTRTGPHGLLALINHGPGEPGELRPLLPPGGVEYFDFGDLDGDGDPDLVVVSANPPRCERFLNDGTGRFDHALELIPNKLSVPRIRLGDVDSDGDLDIIWLSGLYSWSENLGDGTFRNETPAPRPPNMPAPGLGGAPFLGDFDGDGDLDVVGRTDETGFHFAWFENLSAPAAGPPVIASFAASDPVILPGERLGLSWIVTGFPTSVEISPAVQSTPLPLDQRGATIVSAATDTETTQEYLLTARNAHGVTTRSLTIRVGNPPDIRAFTHSPALVNQGDPVELAWDIARADTLALTGDLTGQTGISLIPGAAPFTTYEITAANIFGSASATAVVEVNRPPTAVPLPEVTANEAAEPVSVETAAAFSDPDEGDHFTWSLAGNTLPEIFSQVAVDPLTGRLDASFAPHVDGESLLTLRGTDRNGLSADSTLLIRLPRVPDPELSTSGDPILSRQTGLMEQTIRVTNDGGRAIGGFILEIGGLPEGVTILGAEAPEAGRPWTLAFRQAVEPGASVDVRVEYFSALRGALSFEPVVAAVQTSLPEVVPAPEGRAFRVDRIERLADGSILLEWPSSPGRRYQVEYAADPAAGWEASPAIVTTGANRLQWIDQGPPKTDSHPKDAPKRMYRVVELGSP